jgi:hypothetical protein
MILDSTQPGTKISPALPPSSFLFNAARLQFRLIGTPLYEDEMRLFVKLDHGTLESGKYFYSFSEHLMLREIILAPCCEMPIEGIRSIVADSSPPVIVLKSRIAFTRFEVLENKVASGARSKTQPGGAAGTLPVRGVWTGGSACPILLTNPDPPPPPPP